MVKCLRIILQKIAEKWIHYLINFSSNEKKEVFNVGGYNKKYEE